MQTQAWIIQYRPEGLKWNSTAGWYYGTVSWDQRDGPTLSSAAVGPFDTAGEACMDLTRAFATADAFGPVEERNDE